MTCRTVYSTELRQNVQTWLNVHCYYNLRGIKLNPGRPSSDRWWSERLTETCITTYHDGEWSIPDHTCSICKTKRKDRRALGSTCGPSTIKWLCIYIRPKIKTTSIKLKGVFLTWNYPHNIMSMFPYATIAMCKVSPVNLRTKFALLNFIISVGL